MKRHDWPDDHLAYLRRAYPDRTAQEIAADLGITDRAVYHKARALGLKKSEAFLKGDRSGRLTGKDERGKSTRIQPGDTPWNKGIRYQAGGRSAQTRFKPGHRPQTWRPIGTETITKDGYIRRKVSETGHQNTDWPFVHLLLWEREHGPVPDAHAVIFVNGDKTDIRLDNLTLVHRAELLYLNRMGFNDLPAELRPSAIAAARLYCKTRERERG